MLVVCNGAWKSGSTWLAWVMRALQFQEIPAEFRRPKFSNPSFPPGLVEEVPGLDFYRCGTVYWCKQHWSGEVDHLAIATSPDVRILNIVRDLRDVVVSWYFHDKRLNVFSGTLDDYFCGNQASVRVRKVVAHHAFWHGAPSPAFLTSYEGLLADYPACAGPLLRFVGLDGDDLPKALAQTEHATKFSNLTRKKGDGEFFRKGQVGDHRNHLTQSMIDHIGEVAEMANYPAVKLAMAGRFPDLRPWIASTDIGLSL